MPGGMSGACTHGGDEGVIGTWAERDAQGDMCPRILVARSTLVDEESGRTEHVVSKHGWGEFITVSIAPLCRTVYDGTAR